MFLGYLDCPIGQWIHSYAGFRNPALSGAVIQLLLASWQQDPAASLPNDDDWLAQTCSMPVSEFLEVKDVLLDGFMHVGNRVVSIHLSERAKLLEVNHGEALIRLQASVTATTLEPEHFTLHGQSQDTEGDQRRKRRAIPTGFGITAAMQTWAHAMLTEQCTAQGSSKAPSIEETKAAVVAILELFVTDAKSNSRRYEDWDAAFRSFVRRQVNGEFGTCPRYFPNIFPITLIPTGPTQAHNSRGFARGAVDRRAQLESSADDALLQLVGSGVHDNDVIDMHMNEGLRSA